MAKGLFATYHPAVCMLFFLTAVGLAFSTQHPVYVALSFAMSGTYLFYLRGWRSFVRTLGTCVPLVVFVGLLNSLFNAAGIETAAYEANFSEACWKKYKSGEGYIPGLAERSAVRNLWMNHTRQAINKLGTDEALSTPTTAPEE